MTPANLHKLYAALIGVLLLAGGLLWFRASERHAGAIAVLTHQADSTVTAIAKDTARIAQDARQKAADAKGLLDKARAQIVAQKRDSARQDSIVRASANERAKAERVLLDSLATVATLRATVGELISSSRADSTNRAQEHDLAQRTIRSLLDVVVADSAALTAEQAHSASLQVLAVTLQREVGLLKQDKPSFVSQHLGLGVGYGCGTKGCEPVVAAIVRVLP